MDKIFFFFAEELGIFLQIVFSFILFSYHLPSLTTMVCDFLALILSTLDRNGRPDKMCHCCRKPIRIVLDRDHIFRCTDRRAKLCICVKWFERHSRLREVIGIGHPDKKNFLLNFRPIQTHYDALVVWNLKVNKLTG